MKAILRMQILLCGAIATSTSVGHQQREENHGIKLTQEHPDVLNKTSIVAPICAEPCQEQFSIDLATQCTYNDVFQSALTRCVQKTCPTLQEVLNWQTYYAATCHLEARHRTSLEVGVSWTLFGLSTLSVIGRFLSRSQWSHGPGFWWDDWLVLALWTLSIELVVGSVYLRQNYAGRDVLGIVTPDDVKRLLLWMYISVPFYIIGTYGTKAAWVLLYMRMWDWNTAFRKLCWASLAILFGATIGFSIGAVVIHWPWDYYVEDSATVRQQTGGIELLPSVFAVSAINIAMDIWVLLLPIPKLMSLTGVSVQRKLDICVFFLFGFVVTACSIYRLVLVTRFKTTTNVCWEFGRFSTWSEIEVNLGMFTVNLPAIAGSIKRYRTRRRELRSRDNSVRTDTSGPSARIRERLSASKSWLGGGSRSSGDEQS